MYEDTHFEYLTEVCSNASYSNDDDLLQNSPGNDVNQTPPANFATRLLTHTILSDTSTLRAPALEDSYCKYPSKPCFNARSLKIDGSLHRFCVAHREKANDAQRRWHARRRRSRQLTRSDNSSSTESSDDSDATQRKRYRPGRASHGDSASPVDVSIDEERLLEKDGNAWAVPMDSDPSPLKSTSFMEAATKAFAFASDVIRLGEFIMELDDSVIEDVRYNDPPDRALSGQVQDSHNRYW